MLQFLKSRMLRHRADERVSNHSSSAFSFAKLYNSIKVRRDILCVGQIPTRCLSEAANTYRVPYRNEDKSLKKSLCSYGTLIL